MNHLFQYIIRLADNASILGHRLGELCGHGPILEQDIAMTNIALDLVGQARSFYQYAAEVEGANHTEDDLAYLRDNQDFRNLLLVEQPNGNFGDTIARQFLYDAYSFAFYQALRKSKDTTLAAIAEKAIKEVTYHLRWSSEWVIRLGDGTEESNAKIQAGLNSLWRYTGEMFEMDETDNQMLAQGIGVDLGSVKTAWLAKVNEVLAEATLILPSDKTWMQKGSKKGIHTEHLGYILAEMQHLQRTYPGCEW